MDILENVNTNISSMVTSSFDEFISTKVKEEVEKEKDKFLKDLNMCEEEYPVFDESKHTKFEACKLVNDNSLPYQIEPMQIVGLCSNQEFILKGVKIGLPSLNITDSIITSPSGSHGYFITNKGNVYQKSFTGSRAKGNKPILYNYKVLEYLGKSSCCGKALKREIVNGGWVISGEMSNNDFMEKSNPSYDKKWVISLSEALGGCGCGYNSFGNDTDLSRGAPRLENTDYQSVRRVGRCHYEDHVGWMEDCIERFMTNNICPDCGSGEVNKDKLDPDINIEIFRNPPIFNNEYIDLLELLSKKELTIPIYQIQTIYAKYHPRANENHVIEEKIKKLTNLEEAVNERVSEEKDRLKQLWVKYHKGIKERNERVEKEKIDYKAKINEINDKRKNNIDDKNTIKEMIKLTKDKCNKKETELNDKLAKQEYDFEKKVLKHEEDRQKEKEDYRNKLSELIVITNDINEINENQEDESCKSDELFEIIKKLKSLNK